MVSTTLLGAGVFLTPQVLMAQEPPSASELLNRGAKLYDQKNFSEAKRILVDIDPAQLPEDLRAKRAELIRNSDVEIAKASGPNGKLDAAEADLGAGKLASAAAGFQAIIDDPAVPASVKDTAKIQLALVHDRQAAQAPAMKELLKQAEELYLAGKLDEAQNAITTIQATGSDLGWQDREKPAALQAKITEARAAAARSGAPAAGVAVAAPGSVATAAVAAAPAAQTAPAATEAAPAAATAPALDPNSALGQQQMAEKVFRERALNEFNLRMESIDKAMSQTPKGYDAAISNALDALSIINANRRYFSEAEAEAHREAAQAKLNAAQNEKKLWDEQQKNLAVQQAEQIERARIAKATKDREQRVRNLMAQANKFNQTMQLREAADLYRQVLLIEPTNDSAKLLLQFTMDKINYRAYNDVTAKRSEQMQRHGIVNEETLIPYVDLLIYPSDWVELTRRREGDQSHADSPANRVVRARLEENLKEIAADQQGFEKVINFLRDTTGTNIFVNWPALQGVGVDRNTPVSVNLHEIPFRKVLQTILSEAGGGSNSQLSYTIDDGVLTISTIEDLNSVKYQVVRVFDIRDMLVQPDTNIKPPSFNLQDITQGGTTQGGSGGGTSSNSNQSLFNQTDNGATTPSKSPDDIAKDIIEVIKTTVAHDTWTDAGGTIGTIKPLNGQLIINQTVDNQNAVYNLLQQLRETRALQIAIEARILLVSNNFFDQFGLDWSLSVPAGQFLGSVGALSIDTGNSSTLAIPPGTSVPGSLNTFGAVGNNALNISGSILDNWTLNLLIRATQADTRTITVDAPRVTLFNGQSGYIAVTEQQNFVSNFCQTATTGGLNSNGAVATNLTVSTLSTGVVLFVEATVSADRRYVVMKARPQLATLEGIQTFNSSGVQNPAFNSLNAGFVQLPKVRFTTVDTMVSVPDGGTLLLGGEKILGESEIEIGVPILSKIPGLQRLFTNRAMNKDERTLLILVRPRIIIQKEIEMNLYGPNYDKPTGLPNPNIGADFYSNQVSPSFGIGAN